MRRQILLTAFLISGCADSERPIEVEASGRSVPTEAPQLGDPDAADAADRSCQVVLRSATQSVDTDGRPEVSCEGGDCSYRWRVEMDVASDAVAEGATGAVLYRAEGETLWREVAAVATERFPYGYTRFVALIEDHLPGPDGGMRPVELIALAHTAEGDRIFDHNVYEGDLDNARLTPEGGMALWGDRYVCTHLRDVSSVWFTRDAGPLTIGELRPGNALIVSYDLDRLPECRATHNGYPAWDTEAFVRFEPSGEQVSGSVRAFGLNPWGSPSQASPVPFVTEIPAETTSLAMWFRNRSGAGSSCESWDSAYGENYPLAVKPAPEDDPCFGQQRWTDAHQQAPFCPSYAVSADYDATNCELYVDAFGDGYEGHYGIPFRWLEAWIRVGPLAGEVVDVGMYAAFRDRTDGTRQERWSFGHRVGDDRWKTGLTWQFTGQGYDGSWRYDVDTFAFFVDVRRNGQIVRLWQSRGGDNYGWDDAFALPGSDFSIPYGRIHYADRESGVFDALRTCTAG